MDAAAKARTLARRYRDHDAGEVVAAMIGEEYGRRIALVSSFGVSAAVLLHMMARANPATPVLFLDTGKHFDVTLSYRDALSAHLGLANLRILTPEPADLAARDPDGMLWARAPDQCCFVRKVAPLERALGGFAAWFTGRRRAHGAGRASLPRFEAAGRRIKVNPLADWSAAEVAAYFAVHDLPRHPLEADGFPSIGCLTCTARPAPGEAMRDGRWRNSAKTECGIHLPAHAHAPAAGAP